MNELDQKFKNTFIKYKKEYSSLCEPISGFKSVSNNSSKFKPIQVKYVNEIVEILNQYSEHKSDIEIDDAIELSKEYVKQFGRLVTNPF